MVIKFDKKLHIVATETLSLHLQGFVNTHTDGDCIVRAVLVIDEPFDEGLFELS